MYGGVPRESNSVDISSKLIGSDVHTYHPCLSCLESGKHSLDVLNVTVYSLHIGFISLQMMNNQKLDRCYYSSRKCRLYLSFKNLLRAPSPVPPSRYLSTIFSSTPSGTNSLLNVKLPLLFTWAL